MCQAVTLKLHYGLHTFSITKTVFSILFTIDENYDRDPVDEVKHHDTILERNTT